MILDRLRKQRGSVSILGIGAIAISLFGFQQIFEYGNAKLLDRELDNYARSIASTALRSELSLTKAGIELGESDGGMNPQQTDIITTQILNQVALEIGENLSKEITFGNFASAEICNSTDPEVNKGCFIPLETDASNPRASTSETPLEFSAVAVRLVSLDKTISGKVTTFTPEGRALYGISQENSQEDTGCYCQNRYKSCLGADLAPSDLVGIPSTQATAISLIGSSARKNYCDYGFTDSKVSDASETKYPWAEFRPGWIGKPDTNLNFFTFLTGAYDDEQASKVLEQKTLRVDKGDDPLYSSGGFFGAMMPFFSSDFEAKEQNESSLRRNEISPSSDRYDYTCSGFSKPSCSSSSFFSRALLDDNFYIGYQGTCVPETNSANVDMSRCLSYDDSGTDRYESCLEIERRNELELNFFEQMLAFFLGPVLNWERSYEGLNCEFQKMQYKGWMFWGGWESV